jgi:acetyl-CoA acyltransferase
MYDAFICGAIRSPISCYGDALKDGRTNGLGVAPIRARIERNSSVDWRVVGRVIYGCANQASENNCKVARMSAVLLAGQSMTAQDTTITRLLAPLPHKRARHHLAHDQCERSPLHEGGRSRTA